MKKVKKATLDYSKNSEFQDFAKRVKIIVDDFGGEIGSHNKENVEKLLSLEEKFKKAIARYAKTKKIYKNFINYIKHERGNILNAKPYFREKAQVFNKGIAKVLKEENVEKLLEYQMNYNLIQYIVDHWESDLPKIPKKYYEEYLKVREDLIKTNIPLAMNRAKIFYNKTPKSNLELMDFVNICTQGLITAIDKYHGKYERGKFINVCIGRMVGLMIEQYSTTFLRLTPTDKKILYRANSLRYRLKIEDIAELTIVLNKSFEEDLKSGKKIPKSLLPVTEDSLRRLLNSVSSLSADSSVTVNNDVLDGIYEQTSGSVDIEKEFIELDLRNKLSKAIEQLDLLEQKIIKLKGVDL